MSVFAMPDYDNHEQVVFFHDKETDLKAIVAIHDTTLGPSLGGTRMFPYSSEDEALTDVLRLSKGMTYKSALAGLKLGGGKSVIIGDPKTEKTQEKLAAFGRMLNRLGGMYIAAEDSGTSVEDLQYVGQFTKHVAGVEEKTDESGHAKTGDPSPATALGCFLGIKAAVEHRLNKSDLKGTSVSIQGMGHVGYYLAKHLHEAGANLFVSDLDKDKLEQAKQEFNATIVHGDEIISQPVDVFAPCAMGAILNEQSIQMLQAPIVAGSANNQLAVDHIGDKLHEMNILYAPDFVINAGGIIDVYHERGGYDPVAVKTHIEGIYDTLKEIFTRSSANNRAPCHIADELALERLAG